MGVVPDYMHLHSELGTRPNDTSDTTLEKGSEALFLRDSDQRVDETLVVSDTGSSFGLQSRLDTVRRGGQVCSRHTGDCGGSLQQTEFSDVPKRESESRGNARVILRRTTACLDDLHGRRLSVRIKVTSG